MLKTVKLALTFTLAVAAASGATIDSGTVLTRPYFIIDNTTGVVNISSVDGNFSLFSAGIPGGGNLNCLTQSATLDCPLGQTYSIVASLIADTSLGSRGDVTINGSLMSSLVLGCGGLPGCPDTFLSLTAQPILISAPGSYQVPFSLTGQIQAAQSIGGPLLLDQTISGIGVLDFAVIAASPGRFQINQINPGSPGGPQGLRWTFQPVPEPSMFLPGLVGLAAMMWKRRRKEPA